MTPSTTRLNGQTREENDEKLNFSPLDSGVRNPSDVDQVIVALTTVVFAFVIVGLRRDQA